MKLPRGARGAPHEKAHIHDHVGRKRKGHARELSDPLQRNNRGG
jgi:hypothetical protein